MVATARRPHPGAETPDTMSVCRVVPPDKTAVRLKFRPFYDTGEGYPYFMYFDRKGLPISSGSFCTADDRHG
jgi:hypothetical protein